MRITCFSFEQYFLYFLFLFLQWNFFLNVIIYSRLLKCSNSNGRRVKVESFSKARLHKLHVPNKRLFFYKWHDIGTSLSFDIMTHCDRLLLNHPQPIATKYLASSSVSHFSCIFLSKRLF